MSYTGMRFTDYYADVAAGLYPGRKIIKALGERLGMGTTASGEDVWPGAAAKVPMPPDAGEQMTILCNDANDTAAGTGVREVTIEYLDDSGNRQIEAIATNGGSVNTVATNIRFVNDFYSSDADQTGDGVAEGDIEIHKLGAASTIYNMIQAGGNKSLVPHRMVPAGKIMILKGWHVEEITGKKVINRIRSTDMSGVLLPGVFCFKGCAGVNGFASGYLPLSEDTIPALSIVKVSGWPPAASGAEVLLAWWGEERTL